jgi:hypothetical protein
MIFNYFLIGISVVAFLTIGVMWILFPKRILRWADVVLIPLLIKPAVFIYKLLGLGIEEYKPSEPTARKIILTRVMGIWFILIALIFLAAALGVFK